MVIVRCEIRLLSPVAESGGYGELRRFLGKDEKHPTCVRPRWPVLRIPSEDGTHTARLLGRPLPYIPAIRRERWDSASQRALTDRSPVRLSSDLTDRPPTALGSPRRNADRLVRPTDTPKRACDPSKRKFKCSERKELRAEKIRAGPHLATKLCRPRAIGVPKRNR